MADTRHAAPDGYRDDVPLYNSRITKTYIRLIRKRYPDIDTVALLHAAGMEPHQVEDEGHWFTQAQVNRFHEVLRDLTGEHEIAREAGRFSASPEALSGISKYILGLVSPSRAYAMAGKFTNMFTRSSKCTSRSTGPHSVEILLTPEPGVREEPFQCENRLGYLEAIARMFNHREPRIDHTECVFKGGRSCRYEVTWRPSRAMVWRRVRNIALPVVGALALAAAFAERPPLLVAVTLAAGAALFAAIGWAAAAADSRELQAAVAQLEHSSDDLVEQINVNYQNALMVNEIGQALNRESEIDAILERVVTILEKRLDYDRGMIFLADPGRTTLALRAGYGYDPAELRRAMGSSGFSLDRSRSHGVFVVSFWERRPILVNDATQIVNTLSQRSAAFVEAMGIKSFISCPIVYEDEPLGVLAVDNQEKRRPLLQRDVNLLMGIAPQIALCLHKAKLVEARLNQFQSSLQVLVASTEARDPVTAGHSLKVTEYAVGICRQLGLPGAYAEMMRVAASLHDYGKIGCQDAVLKKPGRLNAREYEEIKTHVAKTRDILKQINFEGVYREVPEIVGAHHEKLDGTGYPDRLAGEEIPLGARILAVADVFEALTSKRHYRDPMPLAEAFDHLLRNVGVHFDPTCVEAFIRYYCEKVEPGAYDWRQAISGLGGEPRVLN